MIGVTGELELAGAERIFDDGDWERSAGEGVQYCSIKKINIGNWKKLNLKRQLKGPGVAQIIWVCSKVTLRQSFLWS